MKLRKTFLLVLVIASTFNARADEGMWLPSLLSRINVAKMQSMGATLTAEDIYSIDTSSIKDAIIALDHGSCTGELVSPNGLFLTNHHCGYGDIQALSTEEHNYLKNGFWAENYEAELPAVGKTVTFLVSATEITDDVLETITDEMTEEVRNDSIASAIDRIKSTTEVDSLYDISIRSMFENNRYFLFVTETFKDIRLVGTPPHFIGKFGGDTDNWMWPRHTGDFSMFRIYASPDGTPAEYSEENVPYTPKHFLPISLQGYDEDDFTMVMGYPGSTDRYLTSEGVKSTMDITNTSRIDVRAKKLEVIADYMDKGEKETIQYASKFARSSNYYKYSIGQNKGLTALNVVDKKKAIEDEFNEWVNQKSDRVRKYGGIIDSINNAYQNNNDDIAFNYLIEALLMGPESFLNAYRQGRLVSALESGDEEKISAAIEKSKEAAEGYFKDFDAETDAQLVAELAEIYVKHVDVEFYPEFIKEAEGKYKGNYQKWADKMFSKSMFLSKDDWMAFLEKPKAKKLLKDPIFAAGGELFGILKTLRESNTNDRKAIKRGYRLFTEGLFEMDPDMSYYPNANSTMRLTYGKVGSYYPRDAVFYNYFTTVEGYIEKEIPGDREFDVWPRMKELVAAKDYGQYADADGTLHTCFISNNDITGGNSGSPVMDGDGNLIGIAFDGNWEAMSGDIAFEPELQKCINVDIRFVLWVIDKFAGADHLVEEMTIVK